MGLAGPGPSTKLPHMSIRSIAAALCARMPLAFAYVAPVLLAAQVPAVSGVSRGKLEPPPFSFALPEHPGHLHLDGSGFEIKEYSAKPNGHEFGIRAEQVQGGVHFLGFLFVWPEAAPLTSETCRGRMIQEERDHVAGPAPSVLREIRNARDQTIAIAEFPPVAHPGFQHQVRAFVASQDMCADLSFSSSQPLTAGTLNHLLATINFDPSHRPDFLDQFIYARVLEQHEALAAAAHTFALAADNAASASDPLMWRRVATDQASMDYGMAGDLARSRALNKAAIARDPDYPLPYYNLACADAEEGNATAARTHLKQAFDRRSHTLPGEHLPDPTQDGSLLKLKGDASFWNFVQTLPRT